MKNAFIIIFLFIFFSASAQSQIVLEKDNSGIFIPHTVAENETFLKLGSLYNVSPARISSYNSLSLSHNLVAGETIKIPITSQNFEQKGQKGAYEVLVPLYYIVSGRESLTDVSEKFNAVSLDFLKDWNTSINNNLSEGAKVVVGYLRVKQELSKYFLSGTEEQIGVKKIEPFVIEPSQTTVVTKPQMSVEKPQAAAIAKPPASVSKITEMVEAEAKEVNTNFDSDKLFEMARKAAFDNKNYPLAILYSKTAIAKSPGYSDIRVFLGRIYTWSDKPDSATKQFDYVIQNDSGYTDAYVAYADLQNWNDEPVNALEIVNKGLQQNAKSKELLFRKVKLLNKLKRPGEADEAVNALIKIDPKNTEIRALSTNLKERVSGNRIGVSYDYTSFDKQFSDPWHIASVDYSRQTSLGSVSARLNYANRFKSDGLQYEIESYPHISRNLYSYVSFAYSDDVGVFPHYRGGVSLYSSLPKSFEGEVGFRYLKFSGDPTWIYTAALGKYYSSWLFTARTYLTPGTTNISQSYNLGARYYYGGAYDFVGLVLGTGLSPDESPSALLLNSNYKLISEKASATFKHEINHKHIVTLNASWVNTEYLPKTKGNQIEGGIGYQIRL